MLMWIPRALRMLPRRCFGAARQPGRGRLLFCCGTPRNSRPWERIRLASVVKERTDFAFELSRTSQASIHSRSSNPGNSKYKTGRNL
jgi:hypothetical protein